MNFRQPPSKFKNQILTAQKRDQFHSELDLTRDAIGNDATRTVQANADTIIFSCGNSGVGFAPLQQPGKFGFQHPKISCGHVSDIHLSPFILDRLLSVSCTDQSVRIYKVPNVEREEEPSSALHEVRASAGTANTPVLVTWNPQVSGILAIGSGGKVDIFSSSAGKIVETIDVGSSPVITMDWSHDGELINVISKDATLRILDPRKSSVVQEVKLSGTKQVIKSLADGRWVVSSLSKMRERDLSLYSSSDPAKSIKTWNLGTASTPLIPVPDTVRKIVYLLDKSGGTLRWIEMFSPYNEGAAGTSVEQSSNGCLVHPFGLQIMEGEINRFLIADTKGNTVPIKITIGRKSYNEFHDDLFTPIEVESSVSAAEWSDGANGMAKCAKVEPALISAFNKGESLTKNVVANAKSSTSPKANVSAAQSKPESKSVKSDDVSDVTTELQDTSISSPKPAATQSSTTTSKPQSTLSAREQRKWDREEAKTGTPSKPSSAREVYREDLSARRAEYGAPTTAPAPAPEPAELTKSQPEEAPRQPEEATPDTKSEAERDELGKGPAPMLEDEDALERLRSRHVTPALEAQEKNVEKAAEETATTEQTRGDDKPEQKESSTGTREVYRENLSERRAEYGVGRDTSAQGKVETQKSPATKELREVFRENLGERRAEYGATKTSKQDTAQEEDEDRPQTTPQNGGREVYREDLSARRAEYGAPSKLNSSSSKATAVSRSSTPALSAREQRKWDKDEAGSKATSPAPTPAKEPEIYREDKTARRAEYGASTSPSKSTQSSTAQREVFKEDLSARRAEYGAVTPTLKEPTTAYKEMTKALGKTTPTAQPEPAAEEVIPYKKDDDLEGSTPTAKDAQTEELENVYAPPIEESKLNEKKVDVPVDEPAAIVDKDTPPEPKKTTIDRAATAPATTSSAPSTTSTNRTSAKTYEQKQYTRKYLQGKPQHPRNSYTSLVGLNASLPNTARMIHATPEHLAIPLAGPGGCIAIIPVEKSGRLPALLTGFTGGAQVVDFELDRYKSGRLASAHVDNCVKIWTIPADLEELEGDVDTADKILKGMDRILAISFHPIVKSLLMVTTATKIHLFDIDSGNEIKVIPSRGVANSCWSLTGDKIAVGKSDKSISILDARSGEEVQTLPSAHSSTRPFRIAFVGEDRIITAGFGRGSTRELALYDLQQSKDIQVHEMDISPSPFALPYFDEMSKILYLVPRGSSNILPFHITGNTIVPLTAYTAADPIMGTAFFATQDLDIKEVEIARCVRLSTNEITVVGFHIPRPAGDFFHDDIYPEQVRDAYTSTYTVDAWLAGTTPKDPKTINLNPEGLKGASAAGIGSVGKKSSTANLKTTSKIREPETKKPSELDQMFSKAKNMEGDEPENINKNKNTEWD